MIPAFRCGRETPWGGENLRNLYNKYALGTKIGESYELSARDGLQSCSADGRTLKELVETFGSDLVGSRVKGEFPLTIKLVDTKQSQSICVRAMAETENSMGIFVVQAEQSSEIVCGLTEGTTADILSNTLDRSGDIKQLLQTVTVDTGDSLCVAEGVVSGIGAGLLLYVIEDSSGAAWRLLNWNAENASWTEKATQYETAARYLKMISNTSAKIVTNHDSNALIALDAPRFQMQRLRDAVDMKFSQTPEHFTVLTCLSPAEMRLESGKMMYLSAGQTVLIPAMTCSFTFTCGNALYVFPKV